MRLLAWVIAWVVFAVATLLLAVYGTGPLHNTVRPEPKLAAGTTSEESLLAWEGEYSDWTSAREVVIATAIIVVAVIDIAIGVFLFRRVKPRRDGSAPVASSSEPSAGAPAS